MKTRNNILKLLFLFLASTQTILGQSTAANDKVAVNLHLSELEIRNDFVQLNQLLNTAIVSLIYTPGARVDNDTEIKIYASMEISNGSSGYFGLETNPVNLYTHTLGLSGTDVTNGFTIRQSGYNDIVGMGGTRIEQYSTAEGLVLPTGMMRVCFKVFNRFGTDDITDYGSPNNHNCVEVRVDSYLAPAINNVMGTTCDSSTPLISSDGSHQPPLNVTFLPAGIDNITGSIPPHWGNEVVLLDLGEASEATDPNQLFQAVSSPDGFILEQHPSVIAIAGGFALSSDMVITINKSNYGAAAELIPGHKYAVFIRLKDTRTMRPIPTVQNGGLSQPCTFVYGGTNTSTTPITLLGFPSNNSYMPFMGFPVMVKFEPYDNAYSGFDYVLELNGVTYPRPDEADWGALGPQRAQARHISGITQEESQYLILSPLNNLSWRNAMFEPVRGQDYIYNIDFDMFRGYSNRTTLSSTLRGSYKPGMPPSQLVSPHHNDTVPPGNVKFTVKPAEFSKITELPLTQILQATRTQQGETYLTKVKEVLVLEIASKEVFSDILYRDTLKFEHSIMFSQIAAFKDQITQDKIFTIDLPVGEYYWRTRWIKDHVDVDRFLSNSNISYPTANSQYYSESKVNKLKVGSAPAQNPAVAEAPPQECDCDIPVTPGTAVSLAVNEKIKIGRFELEVREITGTESAGYSGKGLITNFNLYGINPLVPIEFSNLKVQSSSAGKTAFAGKAVSSTRDNIPGLSGDYASWVNNIVSITKSLSGDFRTPFGVDQKIDGHEFAFVLEKMEFTSQKAFIEAKAGYKVPGDFLASMAVLGIKEACIKPGGFAESVTFSLAETVSVGNPSNIQQYSVNFSSTGDNETSLSFNCDGFNKLVLAGEVAFSREGLVPVNASGAIEEGQQVKAEFAVGVSKTDGQLGLIADLKFNKSFQFTALPGFEVTVGKAVVDMSEAETDSDVTFPDGYFDDNSPVRNEKKLWTGFFLKELSMKLPKDFKNASGDPMQLSLKNIIVDNFGITGKAALTNLANTGKADAFYFTLDELYLEISKNQFKTASMKGKLGLPIFENKEEDYFEYSSALDNKQGELEYKFVITVPQTGNKQLSIKMWDIAKIQLKDGTSAKLVIGNKSGVEFNLSGSLAFSGTPEGSGFVQVEIPSIEVENLFFSTLEQEGDKKQASLGDIKVAGKSVFGSTSQGNSQSTQGSNNQTPAGSSNNGNVGGFSLGIKNIEFSPEGNLSAGEITLPLKVVFELSLADVLKVEAIDFTLVGTAKLDQQKNLSFTFSDFKGPSKIVATGDIAGVKIEGCVKFMEEGKGISGSIKAEIPMLGVIGVAATFGEESDAQGRFNYFNIQAMFRATKGVTLFAGIDLYGLSGGVWHHMSVTSDTTNMTASIPNGNTAGAYGRSQTGSLGETCGLTEVQAKGMTFTPNRKTEFGFKFGAFFGSTGSETTYNFDVNLSAQVDKTIGLNYISINGNLYVMKDIGPKDESAPLQVNAKLGFVWQKVTDEAINNTQEIIDASFTLSVLLKFGGANLIYGVGGAEGEYLAMETKFHCESNSNGAAGKWHFIMGSIPEGGKERTQSGGIKLELGPINMGIDSYLYAGENSSEIPTELPEPPTSITDIIGKFNSKGDTEANDFTKDNIIRNQKDVNAGFGFGLFVEAKIEPTFLIFYAKLGISLGFDVAFASYRDGYCRTAPNSHQWYAHGQAYAGISGEFGIGVDLFFIKGKFPIVSLDAAVGLRGGLPDPAYFQGMVGMRYSILGGMVSGQCNFKMDIGDKCPANSPLGDVQFVTDLQPEGGNNNVSVYAKGRAAFSYPMGKPMELIDSDGNTRTYKPLLRSLVIKNKGGIVVTKGIELANDAFSAVTKSEEKLAVNTKYTVQCIVGFQEKKANSPWVDVDYLEDPSNDFETEKVEALELSKDRIAYTWPFQNQRYFLKNEDRPDAVGTKGKGLIQFTLNQADKFITKPQSNRAASVPVPAGGIVKVDAKTGSVGRSEPSRVGNSLYIEELTYSYILRIVGPTGKVSEQTLTDFSTTNVDKVFFDIPNNLQAETIYTVMLIRRQQGGAYRQAILQSSRTLAINKTEALTKTEGLTDEEKSRIAANSAEQLDYKLPREAIPASESIIYTYSFRTSKFNTAAEKLGGLQLSMDAGKRNILGASEPFDVVELQPQFGSGGTSIPLAPIFRTSLERTPELEGWVDQVGNQILQQVSSARFVSYHNNNSVNTFNASLNNVFQDIWYRNRYQGFDSNGENFTTVPVRSGEETRYFAKNPVAEVKRWEVVQKHFLNGSPLTFDIYKSFDFPKTDVSKLYNSSVEVQGPIQTLLSDSEVMAAFRISENMSSGATPNQGIPATYSQTARTLVQTRPHLNVAPAAPSNPQVYVAYNWSAVFSGSSNTATNNATAKTQPLNLGNTIGYSSQQLRVMPNSSMQFATVPSAHSYVLYDNNLAEFGMIFNTTSRKLKDLVKFIDPTYGNILAYNAAKSTPSGIEREVRNYLLSGFQFLFDTPEVVNRKKTIKIGYGTSLSSAKTLRLGQ